MSQGVLKLNVDGATFDDENAIGTGAIIRDWRGKFIVASVKKFEGEVEPMTAEIRAVKEGLGLAFNLGIRALHLEGDAKLVLESFDKSTSILTHNGLILSEAYNLASRFTYFKAQYIPRSGNLVADKLAKLAKTREYQMWVNVPPICILDVLAQEP